ncbi:glycosyltransferase [Dactylosporangium matsuzakiense]|uniref:Glycosyl transferase family 1 n=1 Tax=Dactylosporangium matsuzakiense TaxID=53360 RepID=A0A9W6NMD0_9ACTN|nr:glycosyltransferase [Dactylosporangium matsuzakiense]GLL02279.1 glycosyl transferase family 1 [Dactylosporangium matsuzakiense]
MTSYGFLSTYPPTQCGLATFTASLLRALTSSAGGDHAGVVRLVEATAHANRPEVVGTLRVNDPGAERPAAALLDRHDVVIVQHEYGIFGGLDGEDLLPLLRRLRAPVIVVLHTVLERPTGHQREVLEQVVALAGAAVTMSETARARLVLRYGVDPGKVVVIPHGASERPPLRLLNTNGEPTILTWGLLGPGKGIEWAIGGLRLVRHLAPRPRYVIAGQTHPKVLTEQGEAYRLMLYARIRALGLGGLVSFERTYLDQANLDRLVGRADIVLLPYDSPDQAASGVLVEALAAHKPVIATAFSHAQELLSDGAGLLVPHRDPAAIGAALKRVLTEPDLVADMYDKSRRIAQGTRWSAVAASYRTLAATLLSRTPVPL